MEQLLIDAQMWEDIKRTWAGMEVDEAELALEVIEKVGPKGQYLSHPHTLSDYRKLHVQKYRDRSSYSAWEASGKKDMLATVQAEVKDILARHKPKPLDKDVELKPEEIERRASKAVA